jgi:phosphoribosylaminoimidazole (AIR) synthetase
VLCQAGEIGDVAEVLEPMKICVKPLLSVAEELKVKAAVHIISDAYLKFDIHFEFDNFILSQSLS